MTNSERYLEESQAGEVFVRPAKPSAMFNCFAAERLADGGRISCLAGGGGEPDFPAVLLDGRSLFLNKERAITLASISTYGTPQAMLRI